MPEPITDDLIPEVRAALAKATPGPWRWDGDQWLDGGDAYVLTADCPEACCRTHDILIPHIADEDARLIANAPAWLEALCDEVERLRRESAHEREITDKAITHAQKAEAAVERVRSLADWHETKADKARRFPGAEVAIMEKAARVHDDAARRLRAALDGE